jgi:leucyl aminopeptidase
MASFHKSLTHNIIGLIPLVENLVSGSAYKPGDIITAYNGKTVEVANTDAEGRLIMADALSYACSKYDPKYILDFATLTGHSSMMHCGTSFVHFTLDDALARLVATHAAAAGERTVRMPTWVEYIRYTKSAVADFKNANYDCSRSDGFMASLFMLNFIDKKYWDTWVHFDITHVERKDGVLNANSIATGINVMKSLCL